MGVSGAAADLLARLANLEVVEPDHTHECCGFGGTFAVKQPEISAAMAADKAAAILATGARVLVGQDCGCLLNLGGTLAYGLTAKGLTASPRTPDPQAPVVKHIAELLWERTHAP